MRYCKVCVTPDSRPNIQFDRNGVCNGCVGAALKREVDWKARAQAFAEIVRHAKARSKGYDCVIPVSGGKDSTWQVVKSLEYGLKPLAVSWKPPQRTKIGKYNLDNLIQLGVDHIDYQVSPKVEKKFLYQALVRYGATAIPMHMAMFSIPLTLAVKFRIPLVVWGENSALEYGGSEEERWSIQLNTAWIKKYGVTHGTTARDWISEALSEKELTPYFCPSDGELEEAGVSAVFLGHYFRWDPVTSLEVAKAHGFRAREEGPKTGYYNYADIDDEFISIHHYLKWHKFGFTRLFDNLSIEIRNGRMSREEAIRILRERGDQTPREDIAKFCDFVGISQRHFFEVIEKFRNPKIWSKRDGKWMIDNFLFPDWNWDEDYANRSAA